MNIFYFPTYLTAYILILMFIIGACMGSFINCIQLRLTNKSGSILGRSSCPGCGHKLGLFELFPVFSYIFLGGKCRHCKEKISPRYLCVELIFGAFYTAFPAVFGISYQALEYLILFTLLGASSLCDITTFEVPDSLAVIEAVVFLLFAFTYPEPWVRIKTGLLGALIYGGGILLLSLAADKIYKRDTLGGADIKLIAVLGLYFGPVKMLFLVILSCLIGIVVAMIVKAGFGKEFPFIPAIALGAFVTAIAGEPIIRWYLGLFHIH